MDHDTDIGGPGSRFPATRHSAVHAVRSADAATRERAFETLVSSYWKPVYKYIRFKWNATNEQAKDLTQGFFARVMERGDFDSYDPSRALFRTFLRTCLDRYVANERLAARRLKRGGDRVLSGLDFAAAESEYQVLGRQADGDLDAYFHREWVRSLFGMAIDDLRRGYEQSGKSLHFALFERYDLQRENAGPALTYAELGREFGLSESQVTNYLAAVRRKFREIVLERLREMSGSDAEFRQEARALLGVDAP